MKQFKARKIKKKNKKVKLFIFTFFFFFSYVFVIKYLSSFKLSKKVLNDDINIINFDIKSFGIKKIDKVINTPNLLLNKNVRNAKETNSIKKVNVTNSNNIEQKEDMSIYVYNTHQGEEYVDYSVYDAANLLNNKLNEKGVISYFEEQNVKVFLEQNDLKYYKSYIASRKYLNDAVSKYPSLKYFFDIHRDSIGKEKSTITYNNKSYAKVLFVVGSDNPNNKNNYDNASKLNEIIKNKVQGISRGIANHGGAGYNGVYNQDFSDNVFLIEIGGKDNTKEEVINTINVIHESIMEYIRGVI